MSVWKRIHQAIRKSIKEEDKVFELAFLRFGEARKWLVEQVNPQTDWKILEVGYGQGYLSVELTSVLKSGKVVGVDLLHESCTVRATRWIARQVGVEEKIALVASDSTKLPFMNATFDAAVSFLALQDIIITRGSEGVFASLDETCRVVKCGGVVGIADDSFPSCKPEGEQGRVFDAFKRYWRNLLPSEKELVERLRMNGISDVKALQYDPKERLPPRDAERELRLGADWAKPLGTKVDFDSFWREVGETIRKQGRVYSKVVLLLGTKTKLGENSLQNRELS